MELGGRRINSRAYVSRFNFGGGDQGKKVEMLSGGDMLIRALADEGVETVFGYPGGAALHIYDAIFRHRDFSSS